MIELLQGDCLQILPTLRPASVQCCVTSPPYWGLRDYGTSGQFGLEESPEHYVKNLVAVFREVWRILCNNGTLWLVIGDSYHNGDKGGYSKDQLAATDSLQKSNLGANFIGAPNRQPQRGLKPKDLCMIPARVALALQADGWYLRSDIIWHKSNPMPESVTDRPTKAHEYIFLLAKQERYFYNAEAIRENASKEEGSISTRTWRYEENNSDPKGGGFRGNGRLADRINNGFRNKRSVWTIPTQPYTEAHYATFPEELPKLCIMAGSKPRDTILDPFAGSGTTGQVALELGRKAILIELNPAHIKLANYRTNVTPGFGFF